MRISVCIAILSLVFSGCATIIGGRHYNANIVVDDYRAQILYDGKHVGYGYVNIKVQRRKANEFTITIRRDLCETQEFHYTQRSFRGWAFFGTVVGWTGVYTGEDGGTFIPLPWGIVVDSATGALWKPNLAEPGVYKVDYNNYNYLINYTGCKALETEELVP